ESQQLAHKGALMSARTRTIFALLLAAQALAAQVATGNIRGTVVDTSEALVPGATVTLTNAGTGFTRTVTTNDRGDFDPPSMPLGDYQISVEMRGFQKKVLSGVNLQVDQT